MNQIHKYPRTHHLEGSRLQPGDEDLDSVPFAGIRRRHVVAEEKLDGANCGLSFPGGELRLQSRGHYLTGGPRERHFTLFKQWAHCHAGPLRDALGTHRVLYGEWLYAKHTIFYDELPHYFMEFDVLDTRTGEFLSTPRRRELLAGLPVVPVPVLFEGAADSLDGLTGLIGPSLYKSAAWRDRLAAAATAHGLDPERVARETDPSDHMEGLYIKVEEGGCVVERYKYIRAGFLTSVVESSSHWLSRPIVPNRLRADADIFGAGR